MKPEQKDYALRHYPQHLAEAGRRDQLHTLLTSSPEWMRRTYKYSQTDALYVEQVQLAISLYDATTSVEDCIQLIELWTTLLVVRQHVNHYTDTDLETLTLLGRTEEALSQSRLRSSRSEVFHSLWKIYQILEQRRQPDSRLFREVIETGKQIDTIEQRSEALSELVNYLVEQGDMRAAEELVPAIQSPYWQILILVSFALTLRKTKQVDEANIYAQAIPKLIPSIQSPVTQIITHCAFAMLLTEFELPEQAEQILLDCEDAVDALPSEIDQI